MAGSYSFPRNLGNLDWSAISQKLQEIQANNIYNSLPPVENPFGNQPNANNPEISQPTPPNNPLNNADPTIGKNVAGNWSAPPNYVASQTNPIEAARIASLGITDKNFAPLYEINTAKLSYESAPDGTAGDAQRKAAAEKAKSVRDWAAVNNINLGAWGDGSNLSGEQSALALGKYLYNQQEEAQKKFQGVKDNLRNNYSQSSQQFYDNRYLKYRQDGYNHRQAVIKAGQDATSYRDSRVETLKNAIDEYGINGDVMNQFGVGLVSQLADEGAYGSNAANVYANAFDMPLKNAEHMRKIQELAIQQDYNLINSAIAHGYNLEKLFAQGGINDWLNANAHNRNEETLNNNVDRNIQTHEGTAEIDQKNLLERLQTEYGLRLDNEKQLADYANLKKIEAANAELENEIRNISIARNCSPAEAMKIYYMNKYSKVSKFDEETLKNRNKLENYVMGQFGWIESCLVDGDFENAAVAIEALEKSLSDQDDKYNELLRTNIGKTDMQTLRNRLKSYRQVINGEKTLEQLQSELSGRGSAADLSRANQEGISQAKRIAAQSKTPPPPNREISNQQDPLSYWNYNPGNPPVPYYRGNW